MEHARSNHGIVAVSIGVAALRPERENAPAMPIQAADRALHRAEQHGRNRVVVEANRFSRRASVNAKRFRSPSGRHRCRWAW